MTMPKDRAPGERRTGFMSGLTVGLVAGVVLGVGASAGYLALKSARTWIDAGAAWQNLPSHADAGPLPQTFVIPGKAYDYGATTKPLGPLSTEGPSIIRVQLGAVQGSVGLSLDKPDGSALVSAEKQLTAKDSGSAVYFHITGAEGPMSLLARNYNAEGQVGQLTVTGVSYARETALPPEEVGKINQAGLLRTTGPGS